MEKQCHLTDFLTADKYQFAAKATEDSDRVLHDHAFYEFFFITKGHIKYKLNNNNEIVLQTGDLSFVNIGDKHIFLREDNEECIHVDLVVRPQLFEEICNNISPNFFKEITSNSYNRIVSLSVNRLKEIEAKAINIRDLIVKEDDSAVVTIRLFLYELLGLFYDKNVQSEKVTYPDWFYTLLERFADPKLLKEGIQEIIKPFYFTNEHICRVFKKYIGMTMTDYLNQRKVFEAANMLIYSNYSINEICQTLGISSASYFNKLFKEQYHTTPLKFRKQAEII